MLRTVALVLACLPTGPLRAQELLWTWTGEERGAALGGVLSRGGDIDADGVEDVIVGTLGYRVYLYSGRTGLLIREYVAERIEDFFGASAASIEDVDGDECADHIIGASYADNLIGKAYVYSGKTGALLHVLLGEDIGSGGPFFGHTVSGAEDVDSDGSPDFLVGNGAEYEKGVVYVYSGKTAQLIHRIEGESNGRAFGTVVSELGDVDQDGHADFLVGAPGVLDAGPYGDVFVYSGRTGTSLHRFTSTEWRSLFGHAIDSTGDVDGDGVVDLIIGELYYSGGGRAFVYSGATFGLIHELRATECCALGVSVSGCSDMNGDGVRDLWVGDGSFKYSTGRAYVFSGRSGETMFTFQGEREGDFFGSHLDDLGDLNGDGLEDLVVAAVGYDLSKQVHTVGRVYVYNGLHAPVLRKVDPARAPSRAPGPVLLTGEFIGSHPDVEAYFGEVPVEDLEVIDPKTLRCTLAASPPGVVDVRIESPIGQSKIEEAFAFTPSLDLSGDLSVGGQVTLTLLLDPGDFLYLILGWPPPVSVPTPPFIGSLCILPFQPLLILGPSPSDSFAFDFTIPDDQSLRGVEVLLQALVGQCRSGNKVAEWTNCIQLTIE